MIKIFGKSKNSLRLINRQTYERKVRLDFLRVNFFQQFLKNTVSYSESQLDKIVSTLICPEKN